MVKNAQSENNDIFVNVRMPRDLVEKLDKFEESKNLTRSKKVIRAVEFLSESKVCPRCHTINAKNSVICSVCKSDFRIFDIIRSMEAIKLYLIDYEKEHPLNDKLKRYSYSFTWCPLTFHANIERKLDPYDEEDSDILKGMNELVTDDGYLMEETFVVSKDIIDNYSNKVTDELIVNNPNYYYLISIINKDEDAKTKKVV